MDPGAALVWPEEANARTADFLECRKSADLGRFQRDPEQRRSQTNQGALSRRAMAMSAYFADASELRKPASLK